MVQVLKRILSLAPLLLVALPARLLAGGVDVARINAEAGGKWQAVENHLTRLTPEERRARGGLRIPSREEIAARTLAAEYEEPTLIAEEFSAGFAAEPLAAPPPSLDWRNYGPGGDNFVTPVRNQGICGACWAFAATAVLESKYLITWNLPGQDLDLSEQVLLACQGPTGSGLYVYPNSCAGGSLLDAALFIRDTGLPTEDFYPYIYDDGECGDATPGWEAAAYRIDSFVDAYPPASKRVTRIKRLVKNYGPTAVGLNLYDDLYAYGSGVYEKTPSAQYTGGHAVVVVGWNDAGGYFIAKNSWGTGWGMGGYLRIDYSQTAGELGFPGGVAFGSWVSAYGNAFQNGVLADLEGTDFSAPAPFATSGLPFSVEATVRNGGVVPTGRATTARLWLSKDGDNLVGDDWPAGAATVPDLAAGEEAVVSWPIAEMPSFGRLPREIRPIVILDTGKDVIELNEHNKFAAPDPLFTVSPPVWARVLSPNGGELWHRGEEVAIAWEQEGCSSVDLQLRRRTAYGWRRRAIASGVPATGSPLLWTVPPKLGRSTRYKVRVLCAEAPAARDLSNRFFTVR